MKLMTQNMANYDDTDHPDWPDRREILAQTIREEAPDVVALQEVRFNPAQPTTAATGQNMAEQLLARLVALDGATWGQAALVVHPGMWYPVRADGGTTPPFPSPDPPQEWEGLAILSRLPVAETGCRFLTPSKDANRRITQYAALQPSPGRFFYVFNTHFTLSPPGLASNVRETLALLARAGGAPFVLAGDLNATPDTPALGALVQAGLVDAWAAVWPGEAGLTWDLTAPDGPSKRIDYAWLSPALRPALSQARLVGTSSVKGTFASDHAGLVVELDV